MEEVLMKESAPIILPSEQLLVERLARTLDFAKRTVEHLIIDGYAAPKDAPWSVLPEKIIAETAFLMVFAKAGTSNRQVREVLNSLVSILEPLARSKTMLLNICLKPALALDYAHAHICFNYLGYPNKQFDQALEEALASESAKGIERTPYRMLERAWLLGLWKKYPQDDKLQFWIPLSVLNHPVDIFSESSDGVYALTHAIMYTAFGEKDIRGVDTHRLLKIVEALLVRYMDGQDYDISGELLMAWPLFGLPLSPIASFALNCILNIESRVGFLPAPGLDANYMEGMDQKERRTYIYSINYHTSLVMGLLCACQLKHSVGTNELSDQVEYSPELRRRLAIELHSGKQVHWKEYFSNLEYEQKQLLIPWVYQALVSRYIKDRKYGLVRQLLLLGEGTSLQELPMSCQAKEILQRLSNHVTP